MGLIQQLGLLLKKNLLFRKSHPGLLVLEVVWPILIVVIIAVIRVAIPPTEKTTCVYQERAMPSAGLVPFVQTFVCNLDNKCHSEQSRTSAQQTAARVSALLGHMSPYLASNETLGALDAASEGTKIISALSALLNTSLLMSLENATHIQGFFRDPEKIKEMLMKDYSFTREAADAVLKSQVNLTSILQLVQDPDLKGVACDPSRLSKFLIFPPGTDVTAVSRALCDINDSSISEITRMLLQQLDVREIVRLISLFESLRRRLGAPYTLDEGLNDVADMLDLVFKLDNVQDLLRLIAGVENLPAIIRQIPKWIDMLKDASTSLPALESLVTSLDPIVSYFHPGNSIWRAIKEGMRIASTITDLVSGKGNVTTEEVVSSMAAFFKDNVISVDTLPLEVSLLLNSVYEQNQKSLWSLVSGALSSNVTLEYLDNVMVQIQTILQSAFLWPTVSNYVAFGTDVLNATNIIMEQLIGFRQSLVELAQGNGELKDLMMGILQLGPNVTIDILTAFSDPDNLVVLLTDAASYPKMCSDILKGVASRFNGVVMQTLNDTLCYGSLAVHLRNVTTTYIRIGDVTNAINQAVFDSSILLIPTMNGLKGNLTTFYNELKKMITNSINLWNNVNSTWASLFGIQGTMAELVKTYGNDWEQVPDMLNQNVFSTSILSLFKAVKVVGTTTTILEPFKEYVHIASIIMQAVYKEMATMTDVYSRNSPLGQLVYYTTTYAPELAAAVMDVINNKSKMDMMARIVTAQYPLVALCSEHMLHQMNLPLYVPVNDLEKLVCLTNWTDIGLQLMSISSGVESLINEVQTTMTSSFYARTYNVNQDLQSLLDSLVNLVVLYVSSDDSRPPGPWSLFMYANFTQVGTAIETVVVTVSSFDITQQTQRIAMFLDSIDQRLITLQDAERQESITQWIFAKHIAKVFSLCTKAVLDYYSSYFDGITSMQDMMQTYPVEIQVVVQLTADAYLDFIDALKNVLLKPDQFLRRLLQQNFKAPACGGPTVTSMLSLSSDSSFGRLETIVCNTSWIDLLMKKVVNQQMLELTQELETLLEYNGSRLPDVVLNWTQMVDNTLHLITMFSSLPNMTLLDTPGFELWPFNMSAIGIKWSQFYLDMNKLQDIDYGSLIDVVQELALAAQQEETGLLSEAGTFTQFLKTSAFVSNTFMKFINKQLAYFNSTDIVNILDMLGSDELRRLSRLLQYSPQINAIGVNTLLRLMTVSSFAAVPSNAQQLAALCTNLTIFKEMVAVDDSIIDSGLLQQTVCSLDLNYTALFNELMQNWDGFGELVDAVSSVLQPNASLILNTTEMIEVYSEFNELITSLTSHTPAFVIIPNDAWMNALLYAPSWERFGYELQMVYQSFQNPNMIGDWQLWISKLLTIFDAIPGLRSAMNIADTVLTILQRYLAISLDLSLENFKGYPNVHALIFLLDKVPEIVETLAYTTLQHQEQVVRWADAMKSLDTFCSLEPSTLLTVPPGVSLNITEVVGKLCLVNVTALVTELSVFQGMDTLQALLGSGNTTFILNVTALSSKFTELILKFETVITSPSDVSISLRVFNISVWEAVFSRLGQNFDGFQEKLMSPEFFEDLLVQVLPKLKGLRGELDQALTVVDVLLDQMLQSLTAGSFTSLFRGYPTVQSAIKLLDSLPELFEMVTYTSLFTPEKVAIQSAAFSSFETFCATDLKSIFTVPYGSSLDLRMWRTELCSLNYTLLVQELSTYQSVQNLQQIFASNTSAPVNVTSLSNKLMSVMQLLGSGNTTIMELDSRIFNATVWDDVVSHLGTWVHQAEAVWSSTTRYEELLSSGVTSVFMAVPEINLSIRFVSVILDQFEEVFQEGLVSLSGALSRYPNIQKFVSLLENTPEILELFVHTLASINTEDMLMRWSSATRSWETFCSADPNTLLYSVPGNPMTPSSILGRMCSINMTQLLTEISSFQSFEKMNALLSGNFSEDFNTTAFKEKIVGFISSLETLITSPEVSGYNLHIFNASVWEPIIVRLGGDFNKSVDQFMSPEIIVDFFMKTFENNPELNETVGILKKILAVADVVMDQALRVLQGGSLMEMFEKYPVLQSAAVLLDSLPEVYESVIYTALYYPDKIASHAEAFSSFETFCTSDMSIIFTTPVATNFNTTNWQKLLCSFNVTQLLNELATFQGSQLLQDILASDGHITINVTATVQRIESFVGQMAAALTRNNLMGEVNARFINADLWAETLTKSSIWITDPTQFWMTSKIWNSAIMELLFQSISSLPNWQEIIAYTDVAFSLLDQGLRKTLVPIHTVFQEYHNLQTLWSLLEDAPEMFEAFAFTVLHHQEKVSKWAPAMVTMETFCMTDKNELLSVPPTSSVNIQNFFLRLCTLNLTELLVELSEFQGQFQLEELLINPNISLMVNVTLTVNKLRDLVDLLPQLSTAPLESNLLSLRIFNSSVWEAVAARLGSGLNESWSSYLSADAMVEVFEQIFCSSSTNLTQASTGQLANVCSSSSLAVVDIVLTQMLTSLQREYLLIVGSPREMYSGYPSVLKALYLLDYLPEIYETVVYTSLYSPQKITILAHISSLETFCGQDLKTIFRVPEGSKLNITQWQATLCSLNVTEFLKELGEYQGDLNQYQQIFLPSNTSLVNKTAITGKIMQLIDRISSLSSSSSPAVGLMEWRLLNTSLWNKAMKQVIGWATNSSLLATWMSPDFQMSLFGDLLNTFPTLSQQLGFLDPLARFSELVMEKLLVFENETSLSLDKIFLGAPDIQKLIILIEEPGLIEVLFESINTKQFKPLFAAGNLTTAFAMLCNGGAGLSQYLTVPSGVTIDLVALNAKLCVINPQLLEQQLMNFVGIEKFARAVNGSETVDWAKFSQVLNRVVNLFAKWIQNPPLFTLPAGWGNGSYWLQLLESYSMTRQDPARIVAEFEEFVKKIADILPQDPFRQIGILVESVLKLINLNLAALQNQTLAFEDVFSKIPAFQNLFNTLGIQGDALDSLLSAPVNSTQLFLKLIFSEGVDIQDSVCATGRLEELLHLSTTSGTTALRAAICSSNFIQILASVSDEFNIQELIDSLGSANVFANMSAIFKEVEKLQHNIENLMRNPPSFNASSLFGMIDNPNILTDMWRLAGEYTSLMGGFVADVPQLQVVDSFLKSSAVILEFLDAFTRRLAIQGGSLDLSSVFSESPTFRKMVDAMLETQPDIVTAFLTIIIKPSKEIEFSSLVQTPNALYQTFCLSTEYYSFLMVPDTVNITQVLRVFCSLNFTQLETELGQNFMINALTEKIQAAMNITQPLDIQAEFAAFNNLMERFTNLSSISSVTFDGYNLARLASMNVTIITEAWESYLKTLEEGFSFANPDLFLSLIEGLVSSTGEKHIAFAIKVAQLYLHSLNSFFDDLKNRPITLVALLNNTEVGQIVIPFIENPYSVEELMNLDLLPKQLAALFMERDVLAALCGPQLFSAFAPTGNSSRVLQQLQQSVCKTNSTVMMWQAIMGQANGYQLYQQISVLWSAVLTGNANLNVSGFSAEVQHLVATVIQLVSDYENGSRSSEDFLDWIEFQDVLNRLGSSFGQRLMNLTSVWSGQLAELVWPSLGDSAVASVMGRTINTMNIFMEIINSCLNATLEDGVSMSMLLGQSQTLVNLMQAYLNVTQLSFQSWLQNQFSLERMVQVASNMTLLQNLCGSRSLAVYLANSTSVTPAVSSLETTMCSLTSSLPEAFQQFIDYIELQSKLTTIWNMSLPVIPQFQQYVDNINTFATLLQHLANSPPVIDPKLVGQFQFKSLLDALQNIVENPQILFRILSALGIAIDGPLRNTEFERMLFGINNFVSVPMVNLLDKFSAAGLTLSAIIQDPNRLLDALPVLTDFSSLYILMKSASLQPMLNRFANHPTFLNNTFCNGSLPDSIFTSAGLEPSVTKRLCQVPTSLWIKELEKFGATDVQIYAFLVDVYRYFKYASLNCVTTCYSDDYGTSCTGTCNFMLGDMTDHSMGWITLMNSLERLATYFSTTSDSSQQSVKDPLSRIWNIMKTALLNNTVHTLMSAMEIADRTSFLSEDWLAFKQVLRFLNSAGQFLNGALHDVTDGSGSIRLKNLLPDSEKVVKLLNNIFGPTSAAEMLAAAVNPSLIYRLTDPTQLENIVCNPLSFNKTFTFPSGIAMSAIQQSFCSAVTNHSSSLQELLDMFNTGDMLLELEQLIFRDFSNVSSDYSIWEDVYRTIQSLVTGIENLQKGTIYAEGSEPWLYILLQQLLRLVSYSNSVEMLCENYVSILQGTQAFQESQKALKIVAGLMKISSNVLAFIPVLDDVACAMVTDKGLDIAAGVEALKTAGLWNLFDEITQLMTNSSSFECSPLVQSGREMYSSFQTLFSSQGLNITQLGYCVQHAGPMFADTIGAVNQLYQIFTEMLGLIGTESLGSLLGNKDVGDILHFAASIMNSQKSAVLRFEDLLVNSTDVQSYLSGLVHLTPDVITSLLDATISLNASLFLSGNVRDIEQTLCNANLLGTVIELPSFSPVTISELSQLLCTADVNVTAVLLKDAAKTALSVTQIVASLTSASFEKQEMMRNLTNSIADLISGLQGVTVLFDMFGGGFNVEELMKNADAIDSLLQSLSLQRIVNSLKTIIASLQYFVPEESKSVLRDLQVFVDGFVGLDLIQSFMISATRVSDVSKDVAAMRKYLMNDLGFKEDVANALLDSSYSVRVFLNASSLVQDDESCSSRLQKFLIINGTTEQKREITSKFCSLNETEVASFFDFMIPNLEIGDLVQIYVASSGNAFLAKINMTKDGISTTLEKLNRGSSALHGVASYLLSNDTGATNLNEILAFPEGDSQGLMALQPVLCGSTESVADSFGINSIIQSSDYDASAPDPEEALIKGDFCKQIYRTIRQTAFGSAAWTYIKPIMSGKVLYTPDTPVTQRIMQETQWVFNTISEVKRVAKIWSEKASLLAGMTDGSYDFTSIREALNNDFIQGMMSSAVGVDSSGLIQGLDAIQSNDFNSTYIRQLSSLAEVVYNYTSCIDLDRFEAVSTEAELEEKAEMLYKNNTFLGGIVFLNIPNSNSRKKRATNQELPKHIMYKIRVDMDNVRTTKMLKERIWIPKPDDNFANDLRYMRGFMQLQDLVESAIIRLQTGMALENFTGISLQQMPFPCHKEDMYLYLLGSYLLPVLITFAWLAALGIATHILVYDRQDGQEESLRVMGMVTFFNFFAWLFVTLLLMAVVSVVVTLILKYSGIFYSSNWLILFLYFMAFCFSSTAMCYLVGAFFTRVTLAILTMLIIYLLSFLPYIVLVSMNVNMQQWQKVLACLSSTTAFSYGGFFITRLEQETMGIQWSNVYSSMGDSLNFAWMCFMMLIDSGIYLIIGWYIRNVKPGKYGVAQPWYFPLSPKYWCSCLFFRSQPQPSPPSIQDDVLYENPPTSLDIGISVRGLRKTFGKTVVIPGLDVDIYCDQVTTLLGHNGAAKTTAMSMLVGVLSPSGGEVLVGGKPVTGKTGMLGICPQNNCLFEFMTVMEHMEFYAGVKSHQSAAETREEIWKLLHDVDLWYMRDVPATKLSGGMQRRLCVALAFVGGSKTVVLDEPTSGVDPHARKDIWNLIVKNKPGRTILMSTHHLDEADMLSDRILVLHSGRLRCAGSPVFLKDRLGGGYKLTLSMLPSQHVQDETDEKASTSSSSSSIESSTQQTQLMTFIKSRIPHATVVEIVGTELTVRLPHSESDDEVLYHFFHQLDAQAYQLGVLNYGISNTTLEEVFLKITAENSGDLSLTASSMASSTDSESISTDSENTFIQSSHVRMEPSVTGFGLKFQQLWTLILKRFHHYRRNWRMAITIVILPLLAFAAAMGFTFLRPDATEMPNLIMDPALYSPDNFAFFQDNSEVPIGNQFMETLVKDPPGVGTTCMGDYDPGITHKCFEPSGFKSSGQMEQSCTCRDTTYTCVSGTKDENVMQMLSRPDIYLQNLTGKDLDQYLLLSSYKYAENRFGGWTAEKPSDPEKNKIPTYRVWFNNKGYHAMPSFYNAFSNNLLRSFAISNASEYGITLFNHPLMLNTEQLTTDTLVGHAADVGIAMIVLLALSFIVSGFMMYLMNECISHERHLQSLSGVGVILYWTASLLWDLLIYTIMVGLMVAIIAMFKNDGYYARSNLGAFALLVFLYGWAIIPLLYCTLRLFKSASAAYLVLFCCNVFIGLITTIILFVINLLQYKEGMKAVYDVLKYVLLIFPQFCLTNGLVDLVTNQLQYSVLAHFGEDTYVNPFSTKLLAWNFVALAIEGFVFLLLSYFINSHKKRALSLTREMTYPPKEDEDVYNEQERVRTQLTDDALIIQSLSKVYRHGLRKFCAVNHVSFGVGKGECFGLLGVNGAGKTTTFRMLTGDSPLSGGQVFINGKNVCELRCLGQEVGYCPQEDALDRYLTGEETLLFHARLHGFNREQAKRIVADQLKSLHLESHACKAVHTYSGGTKRKLSLAIALLGEPKVLLLDEPTTGMDAGTRRLAWKCITAATQRGQAVVLTSHSMDECDSLCSRLAIMVNGHLKCLGSPQKLKNKFGDGYTLMLHQHGLSLNHFSVADIFLSHFPGSVIKVRNRIKNKHHNVVEVNIPQGTGSVANIFAALRQTKAITHILYYSLTQTTLDAVFVGFAQEQTEGGEPDWNSDSGSTGSSTNSSISRKDQNFQKSITNGTYAYMNPKYHSDPNNVQTHLYDGPNHGALAFDNSAYDTELISIKL